MTTRLDKALKREINLDGAVYTVTIDPEGIRIVPKGKRKARLHMTWEAILSGDAGLAAALQASIAHPPQN